MNKRKVRITNTGYLPDSPDRNNDMNIIPSNQITMKKVPFPIMGIDNLGNQQMMMPGGEYTFPGQYVTEIPMGKYQKGKEVKQREVVYTDPAKYMRANEAYRDSSILYDAYQFQKANAGPGYTQWLNRVGSRFPGGADALRKTRQKHLPVGTEFFDKESRENGFYDDNSTYDPLEPAEKPIIDYYKKLVGDNKNFRISKHNSPDLWHRKINPIGEYIDGSFSPIYKKPEVVPVLQEAPLYIEPRPIGKLPVSIPQLIPVDYSSYSKPRTIESFDSNYTQRSGQLKRGEYYYDKNLKKWQYKPSEKEEVDYNRSKGAVKKQRGGQRQVVYTDPEEFKIANQAYADSSFAYNKYNERANQWSQSDKNTYFVGKYNKALNDRTGGFTPKQYSDAYQNTNSERELIEYMRKKDFSDTKLDPIGFKVTADSTGPRYPFFKKPETIPVLQEAPTRIEPKPLTKLPIPTPQLIPIDYSSFKTTKPRTLDAQSLDQTQRTGQYNKGTYYYNQDLKRWQYRPIDQEEVEYNREKGKVKKQQGGSIYMGDYEFKDGGLVKYQKKGEVNPKSKGWREYKTATGESLYLDPRFKDQRYYVNEKGDHITPDQNMSLFDVTDNIWESGTSLPPLEVSPRYKYIQRPGALGAMETVRMDLDNGSQQVVSPDVMATKREMDSFSNSFNPAGLVVQGVSNVAQGNIGQGLTEIALSSPLVPRIFSKAGKYFKGAKPIEAPKVLPGSANTSPITNYIQGLKQLIPEKQYLMGDLSHHAFKELKKTSLAFSPSTVKALGKLDTNIAKKMLFNYRFGEYPSVESFRKSIKHATLESERLKKIYPDLDFGKLESPYNWGLSSPKFLKDYAEIQMLNDKTIASQKRLLNYIEKRYNDKMLLINQHEVFKNIADESPQYIDIIYDHLKNPKVSDDQFVTSLVKQSNTFNRAVGRPKTAEEFLTLKGRSLSEGDNNTIDVEGFPVSGDYGRTRYKIEPNTERMLEIASTPIEQRWAKRFPETFTGANKNIDFKEGWYRAESPEYFEWLLKRRARNNAISNSSMNIKFPENLNIPVNYISYPQHRIFVSGLDDQLLKGFDVKNINVENPYQHVPGFTRGFSKGGIYLGEYEFKNGGLVKYQNKGQVDPNTDPNQDLTYKDNPEWFDNRAIYSGNDRYDAQIRKLVYEGKASYNPATKVMTFLKPNQQSKVDETTRAYSKDKRTQTAEDKKLIAKDAAKQHILNEHEDFVKKSALATGVLAAPFAASAAPAVMGVLEAPMVVAGSTVPQAAVTFNVGQAIGALAGGYGITQLPNTWNAVGKAVDDPTTSNITDAAEAVGINALDFVGLGIGKAAISGAGKASRYLTTQTPLRNTYKINPWVFKTKQGKIYRQVGKPGFDDAIIEGKVYDKGQKEFLKNNPDINYLDEYNKAINAKGFYLKKPSPAPFFSKDELFFPIHRKATGKGFKKTANSDAEYLIEGSVPDEALLPRYMDKYLKPGEKTSTFVLRPEYNDLSNFNIYKRNWLQGYKPIEVPKTLPGSANALPSATLRSMQPSGAIGKLVDQSGNISLNNLTAQLQGNTLSSLEKELISEVLPRFQGEKSFPFAFLETAVNESIVPLRATETSTQWDNIGLGALGYTQPKEASIKKAIEFGEKELKTLQSKGAAFINSPEGIAAIQDLTEQIAKNKEMLRTKPKNATILFSNKEGFGLGSNAHFENDTMGHSRTLVSAEEPNIVHILESQSDFAQGNTSLGRALKSAKTLEADIQAQKEVIRQNEELVKLNPTMVNPGDPWHEFYIDTVSKDKKLLEELEAELQGKSKDIRLLEAEYKASPNFSQKEAFRANSQDRLFQENLRLAKEKGFKKMRYPTGETTAKIQGYPRIPITQNAEAKIAELGNQYAEAYGNQARMDEITAQIDELKRSLGNEMGFEPKHQTIVTKYEKDVPKIIKKYTGSEAKIVTDAKGNTWYEIDVPDSPGLYIHRDGGLVKAQRGKEMPFDLPLKEQNVYLLPEYNQPRNPKTGEILPDPQRPNLGMNTGATEYKYTYGSDEGDIDVPSIVAGQYIGDQALDRYMLTGERFKTMNDPGSYSKFYNKINQLGLMQEKTGGQLRKVKIKTAPRKNQ